MKLIGFNLQLTFILLKTDCTLTKYCPEINVLVFASYHIYVSRYTTRLCRKAEHKFLLERSRIYLVDNFKAYLARTKAAVEQIKYNCFTMGRHDTNKRNTFFFFAQFKV